MKCGVGIQDLPNTIRPRFRDKFIRRIIKCVFSSHTPWINPSIGTLQQEFNATYPNHHIRLHLDDAGIFPVLISAHS